MREDRFRILMSFAMFVFAAIFSAVERVESQTTRYSQADIEYGSRLFAQQCATCHGATGEAVAGVNLRVAPLPRARTDNDLTAVITNGIRGTGMPPHKLSSTELVALVAYVRNIASFDGKSVVLGDPTRGRIVFEGKGECSTCHRVAAKGPRTAPDLSDIGSLRTAGLLQGKLLDPNGSLLPFNRSMRAVTHDGKVITGRRLNEDTYTVQFMDEREHLVSIEKADLREYAVIETSSMPSYKDRLSGQELADVVAYLVSLRGLASSSKGLGS